MRLRGREIQVMAEVRQNWQVDKLNPGVLGSGSIIYNNVV